MSTPLKAGNANVIIRGHYHKEVRVEEFKDKFVVHTDKGKQVVDKANAGDITWTKMTEVNILG